MNSLEVKSHVDRIILCVYKYEMILFAMQKVQKYYDAHFRSDDKNAFPIDSLGITRFILLLNNLHMCHGHE